MRHAGWALGMFVTAFYAGLYCASIRPNPSHPFEWWNFPLAIVSFILCAYFFRTEK